MWIFFVSMYVLLPAHAVTFNWMGTPPPSQVVSLNKCGQHEEFTTFSVEPCNQTPCLLVAGGYYKFKFEAHLKNNNVGDQIAVFGYIVGAYEYEQWRMQHFNFNCSYTEGRFPCTLPENKKVTGYADVKVDDGFVNGTVSFRFAIYNITMCGDTTFAMKQWRYRSITQG
ncbi:uncharacterized protein LOC135383128 [Ornithodoros turicata]|uniref:uncharacterized protein LOC135383128 n=1 Tax=Ornithodoros turicata TaxID=34597 RepID=UPI0031390849